MKRRGKIEYAYSIFLKIGKNVWKKNVLEKLKTKKVMRQIDCSYLY